MFSFTGLTQTGSCARYSVSVSRVRVLECVTLGQRPVAGTVFLLMLLLLIRLRPPFCPGLTRCPAASYPLSTRVPTGPPLWSPLVAPHGASWVDSFVFSLVAPCLGPANYFPCCPAHCPARCSSRGPARCFARGPARGPDHCSARGPARGPAENHLMDYHVAGNTHIISITIIRIIIITMLLQSLLPSIIIVAPITSRTPFSPPSSSR